MPTIPRGATPRLRSVCALVALAIAIVVPWFAPAIGRAQEALAPGSTAVVVGGGQEVLLRETPGYDAPVLANLAEGTTVEVLAGPVTIADGSTWYNVGAAGQTGYVPAGVLAPAAPAPAATTPEPAATQPATDGGGAPSTTTSDVNLRDGPSAEAMVLRILLPGTPVTVTGAPSNGYTPVAHEGTAGWVASEYLSAGAAPGEAAPTPEPAAPSPSPEPAVDPSAPPAGEAATATELVNLRAAPNGAAEVLRVLPPGAEAIVTGPADNGFLPVWYNGSEGWIAADYLDTGAGVTEQPAATSEPDAADLETTTSTVNLRAGPSTAEPILAEIPAGATLATTGEPQDGFYPVAYDGQTGWVSGAYLSFDGDPAATDETAAAPAAPPGGSTGIVWPFAGGTWTIIQGYNGGTHQNRSAFAQYYYSLDLALSDGETAGQPILAPVSGTIRWVDPGSGGILIDAGNGYGVAMFHLTIDGGFGSGQSVARGQRLGTISGPGGPGYASTPHVDLTCWRLLDGGHESVPFAGPNAISGQEFPDIGGANQYLGTEVTP